MQSSIIKDADLELLQRWSGEVCVPTDNLVVASSCIYNNVGNLVGAGFIRTVGEVTIVLNPNLSKIEKMDVIRELYVLGKLRAHEIGIDKFIVFTDNPLYARLLKKRFGFNTNSGIGLQLEL